MQFYDTVWTSRHDLELKEEIFLHPVLFFKWYQATKYNVDTRQKVVFKQLVFPRPFQLKTKPLRYHQCVALQDKLVLGELRLWTMGPFSGKKDATMCTEALGQKELFCCIFGKLTKDLQKTNNTCAPFSRYLFYQLFAKYRKGNITSTCAIC